MGLMLHIFRKDVRRLWWESAVSLALLATLAHLDAHRDDALCSSMEGLLNLLLPIAWAYLMVILIHEECPVGDRQFWITRPYPWRSLAGAKALFAIAFIHLPSLAADVAIVTIHGFHPSGYIAALVWKQILLAAALTIPVAALAVLTRNMAQFVLAAVVIIGVGIVLMIGAAEPFNAVQQARHGVPWATMTIAGAAIVLMQYASRRTATTRIVGALAILVAGTAYEYMPREYTFALGCAVSKHEDHPTLAIEMTPETPLPDPGWRFPRRDITMLVIPVRLSGIASKTGVSLDLLRVEVTSAGGDRWKATLPFVRGDWNAAFSLDTESKGWLVLGVDRTFYDRAKDGRARLTGVVGVNFSRQRDAVRMAVSHGPVSMPGAGRCFDAQIVDDHGRERLKVVCESLADGPLMTTAELVHRPTGHVWSQKLGDSWTPALYPTITWLSPLNRSQTYFTAPRWRSHEVLPSADLLLTVRERTGCAIVRYEWADIDLQKFELKAKR